jgi:hypothetical protein
MVGGASEIVPSEDNFDVIRMVEGTKPARAPQTNVSMYAPGCSKSTLLP